jgi:hypothetical protein
MWDLQSPGLHVGFFYSFGSPPQRDESYEIGIVALVYCGALLA